MTQPEYTVCLFALIQKTRFPQSIMKPQKRVEIQYFEGRVRKRLKKSQETRLKERYFCTHTFRFAFLCSFVFKKLQGRFEEQMKAGFTDTYRERESVSERQTTGVPSLQWSDQTLSSKRTVLHSEPNLIMPLKFLFNSCGAKQDAEFEFEIPLLCYFKGC